MRSADRRSEPECTACGACCFSDDREYIELFTIDRDRLGAALSRYAFTRDSRWFLRFDRGRCEALTVDPEANRFTCGAYEDRPDACRAFERGSVACERDRALKSPAVHVLVSALRRR